MEIILSDGEAIPRSSSSCREQIGPLCTDVTILAREDTFYTLYFVAVLV